MASRAEMVRAGTPRRPHRSHVAGPVAIAFLLVGLAAHAQQPRPGSESRPGGQAEPAAQTEPAERTQHVAYAELVAAMRAEQGYDARKTTNLARFQAGVLLRLAGAARTRRPDGPPLFISHREWFQAYLERVGLPAEQAPISSRLSFENRQDAWIEYRPEHVVRQVVEGPPVLQALNVYIGPLPDAGVPPSYSYDDLASTPQLRVTVERSFRYRLLDFGEWVLFDEIEGLYGRPTTGLLGALFKLIGEARAVYSRIAVAADEVQVVVGQGKKGFFTRTATVVIQPDGTADRDVPPERPDLAALEEKLRRPLEIEYVPWPAWARAALQRRPGKGPTAAQREAPAATGRQELSEPQREAVAVRPATVRSALATRSGSIVPPFQ